MGEILAVIKVNISKGENENLGYLEKAVSLPTKTTNYHPPPPKKKREKKEKR